SVRSCAFRQGVSALGEDVKATRVKADRLSGSEGCERVADGAVQFQSAAMQGHGDARPVTASQAGYDHADQARVAGLQIFGADAEEGVAGGGVGGGAPVA